MKQTKPTEKCLCGKEPHFVPNHPYNTLSHWRCCHTFALTPSGDEAGHLIGPLGDASGEKWETTIRLIKDIIRKETCKILIKQSADNATAKEALDGLEKAQGRYSYGGLKAAGKLLGHTTTRVSVFTPQPPMRLSTQLVKGARSENYSSKWRTTRRQYQRGRVAPAPGQPVGSHGAGLPRRSREVRGAQDGAGTGMCATYGRARHGAGTSRRSTGNEEPTL